jgi:hypothetical protein
MYDPDHVAGDERLGSCMLSHIPEAIERDYSTKNPVFSDIYDNANYMEIENSIKAPFKMCKRVNDVVHEDLVLQPYHREKRLLSGNRQLLNLCRVHPICSCMNCYKFAALALEFKLDMDIFDKSKNRLGYYDCSHGFGMSTLKRMDDAIKSVAVTGLRFDETRFDHVVPRTPIENQLLRSHMESIGASSSTSFSDLPPRIRTDIVYYEHAADVKYHGGPVMTRVRNDDIIRYRGELNENRYVIFNEKVIGEYSYICSVLDMTAPIVPITVPKIMPGMRVIRESCRFKNVHADCGGRQCGKSTYYVKVLAYNTVPVKIDKNSDNVLSLKDIDELSVAWKEKFTIGRMYAEDLLNDLKWDRGALTFAIAATMSAFDVLDDGSVVNRFIRMKMIGEKCIIQDGTNVYEFSDKYKFLEYVIRAPWVNSYLRNMMPWTVDRRLTERWLTSYVGKEIVVAFIDLLSKNRIVIEYNGNVVLSYDFITLNKRKPEWS